MQDTGNENKRDKREDAQKETASVSAVETPTQPIERLAEEREQSREPEKPPASETDVLAQTPIANQQAAVSDTTTTPGGVRSDTVKSEFLIRVESILSEGLGDVYTNMDLQTKNSFKAKGEELARKIERMMAVGKAKTKEMLLWIKEWLRMIPGVNRFFLDQEAKIKTDQILGMVLS